MLWLRTKTRIVFNNKTVTKDLYLLPSHIKLKAANN